MAIETTEEILLSRLPPRQRYEDQEEEEDEDERNMIQPQQQEPDHHHHQQQQPEQQEEDEQQQQQQREVFTICIPIPAQILIYTTTILNFLKHVWDEFNETITEVWNCVLEVFMEPIFDDVSNLQDLSIGLLLVEQLISTIPIPEDFLLAHTRYYNYYEPPSYVLALIELLLGDDSIIAPGNLYYDIINTNNNNNNNNSPILSATETHHTIKQRKIKIIEKFEQFISRSIPSSSLTYENNNNKIHNSLFETTTTTTTATTTIAANSSHVVTSFVTSPLCLLLTLATIFAIIFKATSNSYNNHSPRNNNPLWFVSFLRYQTTTCIMYILVILFCFESILVVSILILSIHSLCFPHYIEENIYMLFILSGLWTTSLIASSIVRYNLYQSIGD